MTAARHHTGGRRCSICAHQDRGRLELALVSGASRQAIGRKYGVSPHALARHDSGHISAERRAQLMGGPLKLQELAERAAEEGVSLLDYIALIRSALMTRFLAASDVDDRQGTALLAGRLTELLRLQATLTGELARTTSSVTNNIAVMASPLMADLQAMLIRELQPFPEARARVIAGLEELSRRALPAPAVAIPAPALPKGDTIDV